MLIHSPLSFKVPHSFAAFIHSPHSFTLFTHPFIHSIHSHIHSLHSLASFTHPIHSPHSLTLFTRPIHSLGPLLFFLAADFCKKLKQNRSLQQEEIERLRAQSIALDESIRFDPLFILNLFLIVSIVELTR